MENLEKFAGKVIAFMVLDDVLQLVFTDGAKMKVWDDGQDCCEVRYMTTDDDLSQYEGAVLLSVEVRDAPDMQDDDGNCHEVQFLEVMTSKGCFTIATHNEHNGYYGGFRVRIEG